MFTLVDGLTVTVAPPAVPVAHAASPSSASVTSSPDLTYSLDIPPLFAAVVAPAPVALPAVVVPVAGPAGARGVDGQPGGTYFVYTQATPAAAWIINHNFGRPVQVTLFDSLNNVINTDIAQGTPNQATAIFATPIAGSAVIS